MKAWTRPDLGDMPQRQRHMVMIDAKRYPELAGLLWAAGFGQKSQLMLDLLEAGRRHLLKEPQHKRSGRGHPSPHSDLGSGAQQPASRPATTAEAPPKTTLPSAPATDTPVTAVSLPENKPPSLGVLSAFID